MSNKSLFVAVALAFAAPAVFATPVERVIASGYNVPNLASAAGDMLRGLEGRMGELEFEVEFTVKRRVSCDDVAYFMNSDVPLPLVEQTWLRNMHHNPETGNQIRLGRLLGLLAGGDGFRPAIRHLVLALARTLGLDILKIAGDDGLMELFRKLIAEVSVLDNMDSCASCPECLEGMEQALGRTRNQVIKAVLDAAVELVQAAGHNVNMFYLYLAAAQTVIALPSDKPTISGTDGLLAHRSPEVQEKARADYEARFARNGQSDGTQNPFTEEAKRLFFCS